MIVIGESDSTTLPDRSRTIGIRNIIEKINSRLKRKKNNEYHLERWLKNSIFREQVFVRY